MSRERKGRWDVNSRFLIGQPGNPMMKRWRLLQTPWFGIYVHFIYREDLDPVPHDHPWVFWRLILRGGYRERYWTNPAAQEYQRLRWHYRWSFSRFPVEHAHWIDTVLPGTTSLVVVGPKRRAWGFWGTKWRPFAYQPGHPFGDVPYREWVDYRDALGLRPTEGSRSQHPGRVS